VDAAAPAARFGNQTDFARAHGWSKGYVTKLKQDGRLVLTSDGLVDFEASLQRIKGTSGAPERAAPVVQGISFRDNQDRERFYSAELKRLELERETRRLRLASDVDSAAADVGTLVRAGIEAWRDRMPPQLAALGADEARIAAFLRSECEQLLRRLSDKLATLAGREDAAP